MADAGHVSLYCTACVIFFRRSLLVAISLHISSFFAFLVYLTMQSSHPNRGPPRLLHPPCFFVSAIFGNLSSFILISCPANVIRFPTMSPTMQALVYLFAGYEHLQVLRSECPIPIWNTEGRSARNFGVASAENERP